MPIPSTHSFLYGFTFATHKSQYSPDCTLHVSSMLIFFTNLVILQSHLTLIFKRPKDLDKNNSFISSLYSFIIQQYFMVHSLINKIILSKTFFDRYHSEFVPGMIGRHLYVAKLILRKSCVHYIQYGQEVLSYKFVCVCVYTCQWLDL